MNAEFDVTGIAIETPRLILRPWEEGDLEDFYEYAKVPGVGEAAGWPHHQSLEASKEILERFINSKKTFALVDKESGKAVGSLGVELYELEDKLTEFFPYRGRSIGYVLSKDYWGRGLMPEAVKAVIDYLFNVLDYDFLLCGHFDENQRSARVQDKVGFIPYRKLVFDTIMGEKRPGILRLLLNPKKDIKLEFSHPETLLIKQKEERDMRTKPLDLGEITKVIDPIVDMHNDQWFLTTAEKDGVAATLTCAWGAFGNVWNRKTMTIYIRPQRNTLSYIEDSGRFTASFFDGRLKEMGYLGRVSAKDVPDKIERSGLHVAHIGGDPTFEEAKYVIVCRVLYRQQIDPKCFTEKEVGEKSYPQQDYSYIIVGEIEAAYEILPE